MTEFVQQTLQPLSFPLHGLRLVEASAGTGKTWTIAALYVRLVLGHAPRGEHGEPARLPPEILVLTFTEAAARELRDRIRARLVEAALAFRRGSSEERFLHDLMQDYPETALREQAALVLERSADWLDEAAISTIHAWCLRVLQQHAFDSGSLFRLTLLQDLGVCREQAVQDAWRQLFYGLERERAAVVARLLGSPEALAQRLRPLLDNADAALTLAGVPASAEVDLAWQHWQARDRRRRQALQELRQTWVAAREAVLASLQAADDGSWLNRKSFPAGLAPRLDAAMAAWNDEEAVPEAVLKYLPERLQKAARKGQPVPEHPWLARLADCQQLADDLRDGEHDLLASLLLVLRDTVASQLQRQLQRLSAMGFDDLLRRVERALHQPGGERLAETLRRRYPVALIDEFQDTDTLQFRIFQRLYGDAGQPAAAARCLLLIGDPKQAIYSFRGADLPTYWQAKSLASTPHFALGRNFRSTEPLVDAVNAFWGHAERSLTGGSFARDGSAEGLRYHPVVPNGRHERLLQRGPAGWVEVPAMQLACDPDAEVLSAGRARDVLARACAATIAGWLAQARAGDLGFSADPGPDSTRLRPLQPGDIAVLVRSRHEAASVRRALHALALPSVYGSDRDSVWASDEALQLQCWLEALASPEDEPRLRLALATPALGRSWQALERLRHDERAWEDEVSACRELQQVWRQQGVLAVLRAWLFRHQVPARLLSAQQVDGERQLTNFLHLAELLAQAETQVQGEQGLVRHVRSCREAAAQGAQDDTVLRLESDAERIRIVTLHQSKGLEYPVTCLPFLGLPGASVRDWLRYHDADDRRVLDLQPQVKSLRPGAVDAAERHQREQLQEDLRLAYVGMTRPQSLLWLALLPAAEGTSKSQVLQRSPWAYWLAGAASVKAEELPALLTALQAEVPGLVSVPWPLQGEPAPAWHAEAGPALRPASRFGGLSGRGWRIASYSGLRFMALTGHGHGLAEGVTDVASVQTAADDRFAEQVLAELAGLPRGAEIGTFWHDLLEWAAGQGFARAAADPAGLADEVRRRCQQRGWDEQTGPLTASLQHWLAADMALPGGGRVALRDLASYQAELEFWFAVQDSRAEALDAVVRAQVLPGLPRPVLEAQSLNGLFKGFMDLVFLHDGRYYVADYKSNHLGDSPSDYASEHLRDAILTHRYELQYSLYLLALHRHLQVRLPDYDYDRHVGGAVYLFLRGWGEAGQGVFVDRPSRQVIEALDACIRGNAAPAGAQA